MKELDSVGGVPLAFRMGSLSSRETVSSFRAHWAQPVLPTNYPQHPQPLQQLTVTLLCALGRHCAPLRLRTSGKLPSSNIPHGFLQPFPQSVGHQESGCLPANSLYDWGSAVEPTIPCQVEASKTGPATLLPSSLLAADISLAPQSSPDTCWPGSLMVGKKWNVPDFSLIPCPHVAASWKDWFKSRVPSILSLIVSWAPLSRSWEWN